MKLIKYLFCLFLLAGSVLADEESNPDEKNCKITEFKADKEVTCVGEVVTFNVKTDPPNCRIKWTGGGEPAGGVKGGDPKVFTTKWATPGVKTVTVTCGNDSKKINVTVIEEYDVVPGSAKIGINSKKTFTAYKCVNGAAQEVPVTWSIADPVVAGLASANGNSTMDVKGLSVQPKNTTTLTATFDDGHTADAEVIVVDGSSGCPTLPEEHKVIMKFAANQQLEFVLNDAVQGDGPDSEGWCTYEAPVTVTLPIALHTHLPALPAGALPNVPQGIKLVDGTLKFDYKADEEKYRNATFTYAPSEGTLVEYKKFKVVLSRFICKRIDEFTSTDVITFDELVADLDVDLAKIEIDRFSLENIKGEIRGELGVSQVGLPITWNWDVNVSNLTMYRTKNRLAPFAKAASLAIVDDGTLAVTDLSMATSPNYTPNYEVPKTGVVTLKTFSADAQYNVFNKEFELLEADGTAEMDFTLSKAFSGKVDLTVNYTQNNYTAALTSTSGITMLNNKVNVDNLQLTLKMDSEFIITNMDGTADIKYGTVASALGLTCNYNSTEGLKTLELAEGSLEYQKFKVDVKSFKYVAADDVIKTAEASISFNNDPEVFIKLEGIEMNKDKVKVEKGDLKVTFDDGGGNTTEDFADITVTFDTNKVALKTNAPITITEKFGFKKCQFEVDMEVTSNGSSDYTPSGTITVKPTLNQTEKYNVRLKELTGQITLTFGGSSSSSNSSVWLPSVKVDDLKFKMAYLIKGDEVIVADGKLENVGAPEKYRIKGKFEFINPVTANLGGMSATVVSGTVYYIGKLSENSDIPEIRLDTSQISSARVELNFNTPDVVTGKATVDMKIEEAGLTASLVNSSLTFLTNYSIHVTSFTSAFAADWGLSQFAGNVDISGANLAIKGLQFAYNDTDGIKELKANTVTAEYHKIGIDLTNLNYANSELTVAIAEITVGEKKITIGDFAVKAGGVTVGGAKVELPLKDSNGRGSEENVGLELTFDNGTLKMALNGTATYKLMKLKFVLKQLDLTYTPDQSSGDGTLTGDLALDVAVDEEITFWLAKLVSLEGSLKVSYGSGNGSGLWDNIKFDFSDIKNFEAHIVKGNKVLAKATAAAVRADGKIENIDIVVQNTGFSTNGFTLKLQQLSAKMNYDMEEGTLDLTDGDIKLLMENLTGMTGTIEFTGRYKAPNTIDATISIKDGKAFGCDIQELTIASKLDGSLNLKSLEGTVALTHGDIQGNGGGSIGPVTFKMENNQLVDLSSNKGIEAKWNKFTLTLNKIKYTPAALELSAKMMMGNRLELDVQGFKLESNGDVKVSKVAGSILTNRLRASVDATFDNDRFEGNLSAFLKLQSEVQFDGKVIVGNEGDSSDAFNYLYFKMNGNVSGLGIPLGATGLKVTGGQIEFGYNYVVTHTKQMNGAEVVGVTYGGFPEDGAAKLGLGLNVSDITGQMFQVFAAGAINIRASGAQTFETEVGVKVPVSAPYLESRVALTYDMDNGSVDGTLNAQFKVPRGTGEYINLNGGIEFYYGSERYNIKTNRTRHISGKLYEELRANMSFNLSGGANQSPNGWVSGNFKWKPAFKYKYPAHFNAQTCDEAVAQVGRKFGIDVTFDADLRGIVYGTLKNDELTASLRVLVDANASLKCKMPYLIWSGSNCLKVYKIHIKGEGTAQYDNGDLTGSADVIIRYNGDVVTSLTIGN